MKPDPEKLGAVYYRSCLTWQGKHIYDQINEQLLQKVYSGRTAFTSSHPGEILDDCQAAYRAVRDDHPEYFFLGPPKEVSQCGRSGTLSYTILYPNEIIVRIREQLRKSIYRIVRGTAPLELIDREELVYRRIAQKLVYTDHHDIRDHNIVGPILSSSGVCEGYNALLILCYRRVGIPCIKIYGNNDSHCWTIAWINGTPVHCDITWDYSEEGIVRFNYFNLSDGQIATDHHGFAKDTVPECTSDEWNYFRVHGLCVDSFASLRTRLKSDLSNGGTLTLAHFLYTPPSGDYVKEIQRALTAEQINGVHKVYCYPGLHNIALIRDTNRP